MKLSPGSADYSFRRGFLQVVEKQTIFNNNKRQLTLSTKL